MACFNLRGNQRRGNHFVVGISEFVAARAVIRVPQGYGNVARDGYQGTIVPYLKTDGEAGAVEADRRRR